MSKRRSARCFSYPPRAHSARSSGSESGSRFARSGSPWLGSFPPPRPLRLSPFCSEASLVLRAHVTSHGRSSQASGLSLPLAAGLLHRQPATVRSLGSRARSLACMLTFLRPRRASTSLALATAGVLPSTLPSRCRHPVALFSRLNHAACIPPVNASSLPSRTTTHDSGPRWVATPFSYVVHHYSAPVYPDARRRRSDIDGIPFALKRSRERESLSCSDRG